MIIIYGIFSIESDECVYVGSTFHPKKRREQHLTNGKARFPISNFNFKEITREPEETAFRMERKIIESFKAIGQCKFNNQKPNENQKRFRSGKRIYFVELDKYFDSISHASRILNLGRGAINTAVRKGRDYIYDIHSGDYLTFYFHE